MILIILERFARLKMKRLSKTIILFALGVNLSLNRLSQNLAKDGILDARSIDFNANRISIDGEWLWLDNELVDPADVNNQLFTPVKFPGLWNDTRKGGIGQGVATYKLTILLPSSRKEYALELPQVYSGYSLWANDSLIAKNGVVGASKETTIPQWLPQTISWTASDTVELLLQIANFHHDKGGCRDLIYLGDRETMMAKEKMATTSKKIECSVLLMISVTFLIVFFTGKKKRVIIYFALLCATWAIRSAFSNEYLGIKLMPDFSWTAMVRIEYVTLYLTMIWAILFISRLFSNESNTIVKYILVILNAVFIVFTVFNAPLLFTKMLALYLVTSGLLLAYAVLVIVRAYVNERTGAAFLTVSSLLGIAIFSYDIFAYEGIFSFNSILFSAAYLVMFSMLGLALLLHLDIIKRSKPISGSLSYDDLYGDQKN
jgi:hypothetical protein